MSTFSEDWVKSAVDMVVEEDRLRAEVRQYRAALRECMEMLLECAPLVDHNSDGLPPHRGCMSCGVKDAIKSALYALGKE